MLYILLGIIVLCALLCLAELIVRIWEKAEQSARRAARTHAARPVQKSICLNLPVCLPDRDSIKNLYSLSDQFADRFREVVHS